MDSIFVLIINKQTIQNYLDSVLSFIDEKRKEKAFKLPTEDGRLLSLGAAYLLKKYFPNKEIKENEYGKPYIEGGPFFNISHSGDYSVLAIHPSREVGVDIEKIDETKINAIKYTLSEEEKKENYPETLFRMWSNKESIVKCNSRGLNVIKKVNALPLNGLRKIGPKSYFTKSELYKGYSLSITLEGEEEFEIDIKEEMGLR